MTIAYFDTFSGFLAVSVTVTNMTCIIYPFQSEHISKLAAEQQSAATERKRKAATAAAESSEGGGAAAKRSKKSKEPQGNNQRPLVID